MLKVKKFLGGEVIAIRDIIATLNELVKLDPTWMQKITLTRYCCNEKITEHESVQVLCSGKNDPVSKAGFIGLLNGLLGIDENHYGPIAAEIGIDGKLKRFQLRQYRKNQKKGVKP